MNYMVLDPKTESEFLAAAKQRAQDARAAYARVQEQIADLRDARAGVWADLHTKLVMYSVFVEVWSTVEAWRFVDSAYVHRTLIDLRSRGRSELDEYKQTAWCAVLDLLASLATEPAYLYRQHLIDILAARGIKVGSTARATWQVLGTSRRGVVLRCRSQQITIPIHAVLPLCAALAGVDRAHVLDTITEHPFVRISNVH
jgi:hypothetical protein